MATIQQELERGNFAAAAALAGDAEELRWDERQFRDAVASLDQSLPQEEGELGGGRRRVRPGLLDEAIDGVWEPTDPHASVVYETLDLARRLDTSFLAVLAEPGRGKTHFAAQVAGGLEAGQRVGSSFMQRSRGFVH